MTVELAIVLMLLATAIVMFAINRPRMDAVALIMLVALPLTGVINVSEALAGFSDANIVLIAALFVIGDGLVRTGVARTLGDWLTAKAGQSEVWLIALLMLVVCGLGSMMSSTAVTAIFIPVALRIAQSTGASPSRLMMPLSTAALISGMMTLIATAPNLVVSSELERHGFGGFSFFAFTPFGLPVLAIGIGYMLLVRRWLGSSRDAASQQPSGPRLADWIEEYELARREHRVQVLANSTMVGKSFEELRLSDTSSAKLVAVQRAGTLLQPTLATTILAGDILLIDFDASEEEAKQLRTQFGLAPLPLSGGYFSDLSQEIGMAEILVPPTSSLVGRSLVESAFFDRFGLRVIGMRHGHSAVKGDMASVDLHAGDTLLVIGPWRAIGHARRDQRDLVVFNMPVELQDVLPAPGKALAAVCCLALVVGLMVTGLMPNVIAALLGCLLMGAFGVVDFASAYRSIDWKTLVLIVGMLPFSIALQRTGGVDLLADSLMGVIGGADDRAILACLFAITALLGMFISNTATAVLMAPVAIAVAKDLNASPYPFAMIIALAASTAFMTPVSSPVNTLVVTPGDYTFVDFVRVGVPLSILVLIVSVVLVPWLLPLWPTAISAAP